MRNKEELVYDLIFSKKVNYSIDVGEYVEDILQYQNFVDEMKDILKKSKVGIVNNSIDINSKRVTWSLKVKK